MMYSEFRDRVGYDIPMDDYKKIEFVYMYSPIVGNKDEIVRLFEFGGMELITQLIPACRINETLWKVEARFDKAKLDGDRYQKIATMLDEMNEDSDKYWEKVTECMDILRECNEDRSALYKEFGVYEEDEV